MRVAGRLFLSVLVISGVILVQSCGGDTAAVSSTPVTLAQAPSGFQFTDTDGTAVSSSTTTSTVQLRTTDGDVLFEFTPSANVDFSSVVAIRDSSKSVVHLPTAAAISSAATGVSGTVKMYVPCTADHNAVTVCPGAQTLEETVESCENAMTLSSSTTSSGGYTFANPTRTGTTDCQVSADIADFSTGALGASVTQLPALTADDKNDVSPCPNQDLLTDDQFIADMKAATTIRLSFQSDTTTAENFEIFCGRGANFLNTDSTQNITASDGFKLHNLFAIGAGFCGNTEDFTNDKQLPKAGTYRKEMRITGNGRSYDVRFRAVVTDLGNNAAGTDLTGAPASLDAGSFNLDTQLAYFDENGTQLTTPNTHFNDISTYLPNGEQITVKRASNSLELIKVNLQAICAVLVQ